VCNRADFDTRKAQRARAEGTPVITETTLLRLLDNVLPGEPKTAASPPARSQTARTPLSPPRGPLAGRRILVLGGTHRHAADVRAEITARGGVAAVNLSANVTDLILLDGGEHDRRLPRALAAQLAVHRGPIALGIALPGPAPASLAPGMTPEVPTGSWDVGQRLDDTLAAPVLARGAVIDLPPENIWTVNVAWRADALATGAELDVVAFLVDDAEQVVTDEDFVFYNAPTSQDGAAAVSIDGDSEQSIRIDLDLLGECCTRVVIAGALTGESTFGDLGAVALSVDGRDATAAIATLDAGTSERTMLLAEIYRRDQTWRIRAVGQGYDDGLAELADRYGVEVA
jgi:DNA polymerase III subunit epsilon